jgi:hypothetical protein
MNYDGMSCRIVPCRSRHRELPRILKPVKKKVPNKKIFFHLPQNNPSIVERRAGSSFQRRDKPKFLVGDLVDTETFDVNSVVHLVDFWLTGRFN